MRITATELAAQNECGEQVLVNYDDNEAVERAVNRVIELADSYLPEATVYEVRGKMRPDDVIDLQRNLRRRRSRTQLVENWGVAWYWTPEESRDFGHYGGMRQEPLFRKRVADAEDAPLGGYIVIARLRAQ